MPSKSRIFPAIKLRSFPGVMLKEDTELFLDGKTVNEISSVLKLPFKIIDDSYSARMFIKTVLNNANDSKLSFS